MAKKVLIITQNFYPEIGSAANRMKNIYQLLSGMGYDVAIVTTEPAYPDRNLYKQEQFWDQEDLNGGKNIHRVPIKTRGYSLAIINRFYFYMEMAVRMFLYLFKDTSRYDFVFTTSPSIFVAMVGLAAKFRYRCRLVLDIRDLWPESLKGVGLFENKLIFFIFNGIESLLYKKADHIIVNSRGFIPHIKKRANIQESKISFIPNGARRSEISPKWNKWQFKAVYAGNLGLAQDVDIIRLLAEKLKEHSIPLTVIGYGMRKNDFKNYIVNKGLDNVEFVMPLSRKACFKKLAEHSAGIVTLKNKEVFGTVLPGKVIDYMTCRVPIVASVTGYSKKIIEDNKVGFVSTEGSVEEMVKHVLYLKENPSIREKMEDHCENYINREFVWEENIFLLKRFMEQQNSKADKKWFFKPKNVKVNHNE
ncbi:glycosyltransferase family 4 protein [Heyndrickxia acidicola]|uniref:Glycosyltransferase family 4 protein n=1 Tax=Heyndrickxia acidicola TaxID=209389 RepID=A0ABU6MHR3_9BACI|nr:glycosyltransferase family 4 protein [Heyndrickxia acidicola]MED1202802.1 glycosyltransferase family 4 protein [Heyndrickxia acidicola]